MQDAEQNGLQMVAVHRLLFTVSVPDSWSRSETSTANAANRHTVQPTAHPREPQCATRRQGCSDSIDIQEGRWFSAQEASPQETICAHSAEPKVVIRGIASKKATARIETQSWTSSTYATN